MRKILLLTASLFLTIGAMAQTHIQSGQFDANKLYRIYNQKQETGAGNNDAGYMAISVNDDATQGIMKAYDANDESQIWKFVADGDRYKLLNVSTGKYLGAVAPSAIPSMIATEGSATSYGMVVNSDNKFSFWHTSNAHSSNAEKGRWLWNDGGGKLCGWYAEENPWHLFYLEEAVDKTELKGLISQAEELLDVVATKIKADAEIDLNGKISSNADQNAGGGGRDGDGVGALLDSDPSTYLHTRWGGTVVNEDHYIQIDLGENGNLSDFVFEYATRKTDWESVSPAPTRIEVRVSNDGNNFGEPIAVYTKSGDGLPAKEDAGTTLWQSNVISIDNAVRYIRFTVTESEGRWGIEYGGHYFFAMGTFNLYSTNYGNVADGYSSIVGAELLNNVKSACNNAKNALTQSEVDSAEAELTTQIAALSAALKYTLNVTEAGYATMYLAHNAIIPEFENENENGVYIVKSAINGWAQMEKVTGILPANTGVVVKGEGNYKFVYTQENATANVEGNLLEGTVTSEPVEGEAYVLGIPEDETEVALCKAKLNLDATGNNAGENGTHFLNNANKAYLPASLVSGASLSANLRFDFGGTTAIEEVETEVTGTVIYDLTGRRVNEITKAGIYIVNGKKVLVK